MVTSLRDTELVRGDIINPAEVFETQWELADTIAVSGPLFNSAGEFIGLSAEVTLALPLHHGLAFVHAVLRSGESEHAALGAYVVDIDAVLNIDPDVRGEAKSGALLTSPGRKTPAVLEDGPAASAGLKEGDVIVSVDDTIIAGPISLAEVLTNYRVESQATLKILRDGEIQEVQVTFVNYRNLIY